MAMLEKELRWPNAFDVSVDAAYRGHADFLADLFAVVLSRTAFALSERERLGLVEPDVLGHVETLLRGLGADGLDQREAAENRSALVERRLLATRAAGVSLPLADALAAWGLGADERWLVASVLAAEVSPPVSSLLSRLSGDSSGATLAAIGSVLPEGGVTRAADLVTPGAPLVRLALAWTEGARGGPLMRRTVRLAPRWIPLAAGRLDLDGDLGGVTLRSGNAWSGQTEALPELTRVQLCNLAEAREADGPIGLVTGPARAGVLDLVVDAVARKNRRALVVRGRTPPSHAAALVREALLFDAVIVLVDEGNAMELGTSLARTPARLVYVTEQAGARAPFKEHAVVRVDVHQR